MTLPLRSYQQVVASVQAAYLLIGLSGSLILPLSAGLMVPSAPIGDEVHTVTLAMRMTEQSSVGHLIDRLRGNFRVGKRWASHRLTAGTD